MKLQWKGKPCGRHQRPPALRQAELTDLSSRYRELLNRSYVDDDPSLRWCPHPGCEYAVRCYGVTQKSLDTLIPTVVCACGNKFCFGCGRDYDHSPCLCIIVKKWLQKCEDDSETANWIQANTKECPKCQATIEKNGGCNVRGPLLSVGESS